MSQQPPARGYDFTSGSIFRGIWILAVPMMLEMGLGSAFTLYDIFLIGKVGSAAVAGAAIGGNMAWFLTSLANGLSVGGLAIVARRIGEHNPREASHAAAQALVLGLGLSVLLAVAGVLTLDPILLLLGARPDVLPAARLFLLIVFVAMPSTISLFTINSVLRGAGEAGLALKLSVISIAANIVMEPFLVLGWGPFLRMGLAGSALATALSQTLTFGLQLWVLTTGRSRLYLVPEQLRPDWRVIKQIFDIGLPSTIQMSLRSLSRLTLLGIIGIYGTYAVAGYAVANRLLLALLIPSFGLGNVSATLVGQNLGARRPDRAERSTRSVSGISFAMIALAVALFSIWAEGLIAFFDPQPEVVAVGATCLRLVGLGYISSSVGVVIERAFDGAGNTVPPMIINAVTLWVVQIPLAYGLATSAGLGTLGIWLALAAGNLFNGLSLAAWFKRGRWKLHEV